MRILIAAFAVLAFLVPASAQQGEETYFRPVTGHEVSYTSSSASIATAITRHTRAVRIVTTTDAFVAIGVSPLTATADRVYVPAFVPEYFQISQGEYVAAVRVTADGKMYVQEMTR